MSTSFVQFPQTITPASNYMWFGTQPSTAFANYSNYYVRFDVYNTPVYPGAVPVFSNNVNVYSGVNAGGAFFDAHRVINDFVTYDLNPIGKTGVTISTVSWKSYTVSYAEMSGSTILNGPWFFPNGSAPLYTPSFYAWNAALSTKDFANYNYLNYWTNGVNVVNFLTNWKGPYNTRMNDHACLGWLQSNITTAMKLNVTNASGPVGTTYYSTTITGQGMMFYGTGYADINNSWGFGSLNLLNLLNATSYTVQLVAYPSLTAISSAITYNVDKDCSLIEDIELLWVNNLGGWDFYTFYKEEHKFLSSSKTTFMKNNYSYKAGTLSSPGSGIIAPTSSCGEVILTNDVNKSYTLKSKILSNQMFESMKELFESSSVYAYIDGTLYPVIIDSDKQEVYNNYNRSGDRPFITLDMHMSVNENTLNN